MGPLRTAIVYDFDGTLAPRNLPEHTFLPALGIAANRVHYVASADSPAGSLFSVVDRGIVGRKSSRAA